MLEICICNASFPCRVGMIYTVHVLENTKSIISLTYAVRNEHWGKKGNLWSLKRMYFLIICMCFKYMSTKAQGVRS